MVRKSLVVTLAAVGLDPASTVPLYRQLYVQLRDAILERRLAAGLKLPPTRTLAAELGVSRNTVLGAFEQLLAEGYVIGRVGSGTYVTETLPDEALLARLPRESGRVKHLENLLSHRGAAMAGAAAAATTLVMKPRPFRPGLPALDEFPLAVWARLHARRWRQAEPELLDYGDAAGYAPLRQLLATYLGAARGVRCTAAQLIMVAGSQQAIDLAVRLLLDPGDQVWIEDPGYLGARGALISAGARLVPVPIDGEGLNVGAGLAREPRPRMVYVSPSHQFPLGVTLSLCRRLELLAFARRTGAWVLEDDYDSEYRFTGRPLPALQGLDNAGRVIYIGTFSKVMFPSLRLGYLVVPPELAEVFRAARALADRHSPLMDQAVLADFIREGHFTRHIRRMRSRYAHRQSVLVEAVRRELPGRMEIIPAPAGMHLVGWLPPGVDDREVSQRLAGRCIEAPPLSQYALEPLARGGLVLGYAGINPRQIREGVRRLRDCLSGR